MTNLEDDAGAPRTPTPVFNRRGFLGGSALVLGALALPACGGGGSGGDAAASPAGTTGTGGGSGGSGGTGSGGGSGGSTTPPAAGTTLATLKLTATAAGTQPWAATVLPLQGQVTGSSTLVSPDDGALRACVVSRWSDGSAAVVVVAGTATVAAGEGRTLRLQLGSPDSADVAVTPARIAQLVNSVRVDFGSALGVASITNLSAPERIWWASSQTICARYRAGVAGHPTLEAVVDIHAFSGSSRALVEIVVENCKFAAATSTTASLPGSASYTATVSVNGTQVTSVNSSGSPEGAHSGLRAWYASYWVGGDPGLRVTQLHTDLQQHPLFWKMARSGTADLSGYANDTYAPWGAGRHRASNMGGTGDHPSIGFLTLWDAQFLQTGDARVAKASEANALAILGYNINYRDSASGLVPDANVLKGKSQTGYFRNWPRTLNAQDRMCWEVAHHPAAGLMAFVCRPSPVYIEIAQKIAVWNATYGADSTGMSGYPGTWPDTDYTGLFSNGYQIRGRAWSIRSLNHAIFLSPDGSAWKQGGLYWLDRVRLYLSSWQNHPQAVLNVMWDDAPNAPTDHQPSQGGFQSPVWEYHWLICELHRSASARFLTGTQQAALNSLADWCALQPVRWVNEQPNGGWRYLPYTTTIGGSTPINSLPTWGQQMAAWRINAPPTVSGEWMTNYNIAEPSAWTDYYPDTVGAGYTMQFYAALVAAVERQVPGSSQAWSTVASGITTPNWQNRFGGDPRWGAAPKVAIPPAAMGVGPDVGSFANGVWTPGRDANGVVNAASWAITPNGWFKVAGTEYFSTKAMIRAADPTWRDYGTSTNMNLSVWVGAAQDPAGGRLWIVAPGGHAASSNNGIYEFNAWKMRWSVEKMPSNIEGWTGDRATLYKNSPVSPPPNNGFTWCQASADEVYAAIAAGTNTHVNGWWYDQLWPDGNGANVMPTSVHSYCGLTYSARNNQLVCGLRRLWIYDLSSHKWVMRRTFNDDYNLNFGEAGVGVYDEVADQFLMSAFPGRAMSIAYDMRSGSWLPWSSPYAAIYNGGVVRNGRRAVAIKPPGDYVNRPYDYTVYDLDSRSVVVRKAFNLAGGITASTFKLDTTYMLGVVYIPTIDRYWAIPTLADNSGTMWVEIDPTTDPWTIKPLSMPNLPPVPAKVGNSEVAVGTKIMYIPAMNATVLFWDDLTPAWICRH